MDYTNGANWLCRGLPDDLCGQARRARVLSTGLEGWEMSTRSVPNVPVDCFYVYPTVSTDPMVNSDLEVNLAERGVAVAQAAPFASACRVFAPVYRQLTLTALTADNRPVAPRSRKRVIRWSVHDAG